MTNANETLIAGEEIPDIHAGKIKRLERIELLRDALLPKAMEGHVKSIVTIIKCDNIEEKLLESLEKKRGAAAPDIFYTPGECAAILGVAANTVRRTILRGELAASLTPGGHYRIRREEMGRYRAGNTEKFCEKSNEPNEPNPAPLDTFASLQHESNEPNAISEGNEPDSEIGALPLTGQTQTGLSAPPMLGEAGESRDQEMEQPRANIAEKICEKSNEPNEPNPAPPDIFASLRRESNYPTLETGP